MRRGSVSTVIILAFVGLFCLGREVYHSFVKMAKEDSAQMDRILPTAIITHGDNFMRRSILQAADGFRHGEPLYGYVVKEDRLGTSSLQIVEVQVEQVEDRYTSRPMIALVGANGIHLGSKVLMAELFVCHSDSSLPVSVALPR